MSLNPQQVTVVQLVPGKYIRAIVNCHGMVMFDVLYVIGEVFERQWIRTEVLPAIKVTYGRSLTPRDYYLSDLGVAEYAGDRLTKLWPYSDELLAELERMYNNGRQHNREYTEFVCGKALSDDEWEELTLDNEQQQQMDDYLDRMYYR